jgi:hypothetical protein
VAVGCHVRLRLAWIHYLRGELDAASVHGEECRRQSVPFAHQNDILVECLPFLARLAMASNEPARAADPINEAESSAMRYNHDGLADRIDSHLLRTLRHAAKGSNTTSNSTVEVCSTDSRGRE